MAATFGKWIQEVPGVKWCEFSGDEGAGIMTKYNGYYTVQFGDEESIPVWVYTAPRETVYRLAIEDRKVPNHDRGMYCECAECAGSELEDAPVFKIRGNR